MMTPGPEPLSWQEEISAPQILLRRKASERETQTNEDIKGRKGNFHAQRILQPQLLQIMI